MAVGGGESWRWVERGGWWNRCMAACGGRREMGRAECGGGCKLGVVGGWRRKQGRRAGMQLKQGSAQGKALAVL